MSPFFSGMQDICWRVRKSLAAPGYYLSMQSACTHHTRLSTGIEGTMNFLTGETLNSSGLWFRSHRDQHHLNQKRRDILTSWGSVCFHYFNIFPLCYSCSCMNRNGFDVFPWANISWHSEPTHDVWGLVVCRALTGNDNGCWVLHSATRDISYHDIIARPCHLHTKWLSSNITQPFKYHYML